MHDWMTSQFLAIKAFEQLPSLLHLRALVTVGSDDVHDFARNAVLVGERDAAKRMPHLLSKFSLNYFARRVLVELQRFAHIGQEGARDEIVPLNGDAATEGFLED